MKQRHKILLLLLSAVFIGTGAGVFALTSRPQTAVPAVSYSVGSSGDTVKTIQQKLKNWGYYSGTVDGVYGTKTRTAVRYFQQKNNLTVGGVAGKQTLQAMGISTAKSSDKTASGYTSSDLYLLAKIIHAEARGESYTGQVAVGAVILNRVKSSSFPNSIAGVVYQPKAFTAVSDGQINLAPDATSQRAAQDALNGWDPTYGCIYYYNPKTAMSSWIFSRPTVVTIGNHVFCK